MNWPFDKSVPRRAADGFLARVLGRTEERSFFDQCDVYDLCIILGPSCSNKRQNAPVFLLVMSDCLNA